VDQFGSVARYDKPKRLQKDQDKSFSKMTSFPRSDKTCALRATMTHDRVLSLHDAFVNFVVKKRREPMLWRPRIADSMYNLPDPEDETGNTMLA
jgi:hypothetical protein